MARNDIEWLIPFAEGLGYNKIGRLKDFNDARRLERPFDLIESSIRDSSAIFFFPGYFAEISMFGSRIHSFGGRADDRPLNYITFSPNLTEKFLRNVFTGIEYILYKLCHIILENHRTDYHFETQKTAARVNRLRLHLNVPDWNRFRSIFDELIHVRNAFAHSFLDIEEIKFRGERLDECFGATHLGRSYINHDIDDLRLFLDDLDEFFDPVLNLFVEHQLSQIDKDKFFRLCDTILKARSLTR